MNYNSFCHSPDDYLPPAILRARASFVKSWICLPRGVRVLDIGEGNSFARQLQTELGVEVINTQGDLNYPHWEPQGEFDWVFCFEVIEHLLNPLLFLITLRQKTSAGGTLFLTCPKPTFRFLQMPVHFNEMDEYRLRALFDQSRSFRIEELGTTKSGYPWFIFWRGLRPLCRAIFEESFYLRATAV